MLPRQFITIIIVALAVVLLMMAIAGGHLNLAIIISISPVLAFLISRPDIWLAVIVSLWWSGIKFPQAPVNLNAFHILSAGFIAFLLIYKLNNASSRTRTSPIRKHVMLLAAVIVATGASRGFGLKVLGSSLWGGAPYVTLVIGSLLLLYSNFVVLSVRMWQRALVAMCLMASVPLFSQLVFLISGGSFYHHFAFVQPTGTMIQSLETLSADQGVSRFSTQMGVAALYLPLILLPNPLRGSRALLTGACMVLALVMTGFSGSRYSTLLIVTFVGIWTMLSGTQLRPFKAAAVGLCILLMLAIASLFGDHFPLPVQRTLSIFPWADISWQARADALGTTIWRLDVWKRAISEDLPRYWLVGRGFAFDPREYAAIKMLGLKVREWAFVTGSYHSGPLSLIINFGILGFVVGTTFFVSTVREHYRILQSEWQDPGLRRMHMLLLAMFINQSFLFMTLGGDVQNFFPTFLFQAMILEGIARTKQVVESPGEAIPASVTSTPHSHGTPFR